MCCALNDVTIAQIPLDPALAKLDDTENYFLFRTNFQMSLPSAMPGKPVKDREEEDENEEDDEEDIPEQHEEMLTPLLLVSKEPFTQVVGEHRLRTPDFMMVGNNVQLQRAYYARFVHPALQHRCILWSGYINLAKPQITMPGEDQTRAMSAAASGH